LKTITGYNEKSGNIQTAGVTSAVGKGTSPRKHEARGERMPPRPPMPG